MSQDLRKKPLAIALGAAVVTSLAAAPVANATANPFAMSGLPGGYMVADSHMEGKCGGDKAGKEGNCGASKTKAEGKCGGDKAMATEGSDKAKAEGKCGEGKCGANKKMDEDAAGKEGN